MTPEQGQIRSAITMICFRMTCVVKPKAFGSTVNQRPAPRNVDPVIGQATGAQVQLRAHMYLGKVNFIDLKRLWDAFCATMPCKFEQDHSIPPSQSRCKVPGGGGGD